ncbi:hypothetical protein F5890DRAFT_1634821 [Lentinula detonsa]|uniref:WD40 repeat-like protein n=1 Tax=Lentinula detonsa TaxID=2804962 RepID=A0AA38PQY6_9AGAR|nr:hypothetical protein F5890DRAFT_1634821 [Lentinula detonsa]
MNYVSADMRVGEDGTCIWDLQSSRLLSSPIGSSMRGITTAIAWIIRSDDAEEGLVFGTNDGFLCIWKREKAGYFIEVTCERLEGGPDGLEISGIAYDTSTGQLAVVQRSQSVHRFIVDVSMRLVVVKSVQIPQHWPQAVCFGQTGFGGPEIWSFGREDGIIHVLNDAGKVVKSKMTGTVIGHAAMNVKEDTLIIDDVSQGVAVFKLSTTDRLRTFNVPLATRRLRSVAFHDGNSAIISGSDHGKIYIFDRRTGDVIDTIDIGIKDWVQSVASTERNGVPLIFIGRSGGNVVGKNEVQLWEKILVPLIKEEGRTRKGFQEEVLAVMCLLSVLFVLENVLVRKLHHVQGVLDDFNHREYRYLIISVMGLRGSFRKCTLT